MKKVMLQKKQLQNDFKKAGIIGKSYNFLEEENMKKKNINEKKKLRMI